MSRCLHRGEVLYSDLDFTGSHVEWVVEAAAGQRLDRFLAEQVYAPLEAAPLFFVDQNRPAPPAAYAATEQCALAGASDGRRGPRPKTHMCSAVLPATPGCLGQPPRSMSC